MNELSRHLNYMNEDEELNIIIIKLILTLLHLKTTKPPIRGQKRSKNQQLEALAELIPPFNFHLAGSPIAWAPKAQSCCPNSEPNSSEIISPPPNSGPPSAIRQAIDRA